jgi:hypothetical protein
VKFLTNSPLDRSVDRSVEARTCKHFGCLVTDKGPTNLSFVVSFNSVNISQSGKSPHPTFLLHRHSLLGKRTYTVVSSVQLYADNVYKAPEMLFQ